MKLSVRLRLACAAVAVLALAAGCTSTSADGPPSESALSITVSPSMVDPSTESPASSTPASPTPSVIEPAAQEAADRAAIEAQWIKFWQTYQVIVRTPMDERRNIADSVAVPALAEKMVAAAEKARIENKDNYGEVIHHIFWQFDVGGKSNAVIADCLDQSNAGTVDTSTGAVITVGPERSNMRGEMLRGSDGIWRVEAVTSLNETQC